MQISHRSSSKFAQRGQGMTEYIIIVALIAVAAIGTYSAFGQSIRHQVAGLAGEVSGAGSQSDIQAAQASHNTAATKAGKVKGMSTYNADNDQNKTAGSDGSDGGQGGGGGAGGGAAGGN